jgi:hypothetical protein
MFMFGLMKIGADCAEAVAENYGRIPSLPDFIRIIGPYIRSSIEGGISTTSIYEFDDARSGEAIEYLQKRYATFAAIDGVSATTEEWLAVGSVLQLLEETHSVTAALEAVSFRI